MSCPRSQSQGCPGRVESSKNWFAHPLYRQAGVHAVPMPIYGDGVPYVANEYGKKGSPICAYCSLPHRIPKGGMADLDQSQNGDRTWLGDMHLFTVLQKGDLHKDTFDAIWAVLVWDGLGDACDATGDACDANGDAADAIVTRTATPPKVAKSSMHMHM